MVQLILGDGWAQGGSVYATELAYCGASITDAGIRVVYPSTGCHPLALLGHYFCTHLMFVLYSRLF